MFEEWTDSLKEGEMGNRRRICEIKTDNGEMINENLTVKSDENRRNKVENKKRKKLWEWRIKKKIRKRKGCQFPFKKKKRMRKKWTKEKA